MRYTIPRARRLLFVSLLIPAIAAADAPEPAPEAAAPAAAAEQVVVLTNGDEIHGHVAAEDDDTVVLEHPQLGRLEIARSGIAEVRDAPASEASEAEGEDTTVAGTSAVPEPVEEPEEKPKGGLFGTRILRGWKSSFGAGLTGSRGGFEDTKLSFLFDTGIRDEHRRWSFDSAYFLNVTPARDSSPEQVSKNQGYATLRRDWFFPERWKRFFAWAQTAYNYDDFQPWKHRVGGHVGPGYWLLRSEKWELAPRAGFGVAHTFGDLDNTSPEAVVGFELKWTPVPWHEFNTHNDLYVDVTDLGRHRTVQAFNWIFKFDREGGLGFRLSVLYQFDTQSAGKVNDLIYLGSLTYDF